MRTWLLIATLVGGTPVIAQPSCWVIDGLSGIGYFQDDAYSPVVDKFSNPLTIRFNGDKTSVSGSNLGMYQLDEYLAFGIGKTEAFATVETYQVDPVLGIALYTKTISAKSVFSNMSGARSFVGTARRCNQ